MAPAKYPIDTSADEFARLAIQSDLWREDARAMLTRIGDGNGWHVLDLCCGTGGITDVLSAWVGPAGSVVGADLDTAKLDHARTWAADDGLANVTFRQANAFNTGFEPESFDLVHTRFAISTIQDGLGILDHLVSLVRPGGIVFVEEANSSTMECTPATRDWDLGLQLMEQTFKAVGADTTMGPVLRGAFLDRGLTRIEVRPCLHAQTCEDPMTMHLPLTLAAMRDTITSLGFMQGGDLDHLVRRIADHLARPETMTISFSMIQVVGRKPA